MKSESHTQGFSEINQPKDTFSAACIDLHSDEESEKDQWEYEYSNTETETYYLTLDLSTPEVPPTHPPFDDTIRKKTRWLNPSIGRHRRQTPLPPANRTAKIYTLDGRISPDENEILDKASEDEVEKTTHTVSEENDQIPKSVQILDLETHLPIVAFDGHVYACSWAENIGTELIFTPTDVDNSNPLPKLRTLRGNVDLLASSTARLVARSLKLTPLEKNRNQVVKPRAKNKVLIPVGHAASQQRKNQALFLEKLSLAKEKRGEFDSVTINAKPRLPPRKLRTLFEEKRAQQRAELQNEFRRKNASAEEKEIAKMKLEHMDREEAEWEGRGESYTKAGRAGGRPKKVPMGIGDEKIIKSTLWSQRNVKGKGKGTSSESIEPS
ncbi:hypothetical protein EV44_g2872 [Erysiphe necator]|uniref:Transcription factor TFIIIC triple barrel domain-containing protein n=1 Tax=Uncinula necator TaxID=52586 RepID=A0A0B1P789_UNCNE|nr:hypothetical protein EV44_g2872 [Erysiphe necator]